MAEELLVHYGSTRRTVIPTEDLLVSYGFSLDAECTTFACGVERLYAELNHQIFQNALVEGFLKLDWPLLC